ncbi:hypothetical protein [Sabulibacter ruber]|uniref:hypothetical protein n=1 Tax=Sabulibacter ruber TaxID=2811901 RepID=UPI001A973035|nr:hypothetical protein [Sabulibacter ruber]
MEEDTQILLAQGWHLAFRPVFFLGFDISWLVMEEAFVSPYDHKEYRFNEAMHIESQNHRLGRAA